MRPARPRFVFDFKGSSGQVERLIFGEPREIVVARKHEEVRAALGRVERAAADGLYAGGYVSYEASPAFNPAYSVRSDYRMPLLWFGLFERPEEETAAHGSGAFSLSGWTPSVGFDDYRDAISSIKQKIENGYSYQLNYTLRMLSEFEGDSLAFYDHLTERQKANYCAYLECENYRIVSASPELFFMRVGTEMTTRPMKGTIDAGRWLEESEAKARWLGDSVKNRAENLMIVDLLRNDLGRISVPGTIEVPKLFEIERYPTVYQMTSTVRSSVYPETSLHDIFEALFPCGSITGAPKVSTMSFIAELENTPREVYCGTIGLIRPNGDAVFNVAIRTVVIDEATGQARYGVGGGVTWDSTSEGEYEEVLTKSAVLAASPVRYQLLETMLLEDGNFYLLERHLKRLHDSARFFGYRFEEPSVRRELDEVARRHPAARFKVRLLLDKNGETSVEVHEWTRPWEGGSGEANPFAVASAPVRREDVFLYHKTTNRTVHESIRSQAPGAFDVLMWNEEAEITEFTTGNVIVELNGERFTPPRECGLLAGTLREELLELGQVKERIVTLDDLEKATGIWYVNSVRGVVRVRRASDSAQGNGER